MNISDLHTSINMSQQIAEANIESSKSEMPDPKEVIAVKGANNKRGEYLVNGLQKAGLVLLEAIQRKPTIHDRRNLLQVNHHFYFRLEKELPEMFKRIKTFI